MKHIDIKTVSVKKAIEQFNNGFELFIERYEGCFLKVISIMNDDIKNDTHGGFLCECDYSIGFDGDTVNINYQATHTVKINPFFDDYWFDSCCDAWFFIEL